MVLRQDRLGGLQDRRFDSRKEVAPRQASAPLPARVNNRKRGWAKLIAKTWKDDPGVCRNCGKRMKIIAVIGPDQHDVIERFLRHLKLYAPPWKRVRKARGPPPRPPPGDLRSAPPQPRSPPDPRGTIDPVIPDDLYSVDPIPPDDQG